MNNTNLETSTALVSTAEKQAFEWFNGVWHPLPQPGIILNHDIELDHDKKEDNPNRAGGHAQPRPYPEPFPKPERVPSGKNQRKDEQRKIHAAMVYCLSGKIAEKKDNTNRSHQQGGEEPYHSR